MRIPHVVATTYDVMHLHRWSSGVRKTSLHRRHALALMLPPNEKRTIIQRQANAAIITAYD